MSKRRALLTLLIALHVCCQQEDRRTVDGWSLRENLQTAPVTDANTPPSWKGLADLKDQGQESDYCAHKRERACARMREGVYRGDVKREHYELLCGPNGWRYFKCYED